MRKHGTLPKIMAMDDSFLIFYLLCHPMCSHRDTCQLVASAAPRTCRCSRWCCPSVSFCSWVVAVSSDLELKWCRLRCRGTCTSCRPCPSKRCSGWCNRPWKVGRPNWPNLGDLRRWRCGRFLCEKHPCNLCCFKSAVGGYPDRCLHVKYGGVLCGYGTVVHAGR